MEPMTAERKSKARTKPPAVAPQADGSVPAIPNKRRGKRAELNERTVDELLALRSTLSEMLERYEVRIGSLLSELLAGIQGDESLDQKPRQLTVKTAEAMLRTIHGTAIKARKGRSKDFRRLEKLIETLAAMTPPE
jgi:hypothetical protein